MTLIVSNGRLYPYNPAAKLRPASKYNSSKLSVAFVKVSRNPQEVIVEQSHQALLEPKFGTIPHSG
jgi:hypothetical protein